MPQWKRIGTRVERYAQNQLTAQASLLSSLEGISTPGVALVGEYLGVYTPSNRRNTWGKASPYFLPSPSDDLPAVVLTVGAWIYAIDNQSKREMEAGNQGTLQVFFDPSLFDGMEDPPAAGNHVQIWYWSPITLKHHVRA